MYFHHILTLRNNNERLVTEAYEAIKHGKLLNFFAIEAPGYNKAPGQNTAWRYRNWGCGEDIINVRAAIERFPNGLTANFITLYDAPYAAFDRAHFIKEFDIDDSYVETDDCGELVFAGEYVLSKSQKPKDNRYLRGNKEDHLHLQRIKQFVLRARKDLVPIETLPIESYVEYYNEGMSRVELRNSAIETEKAMLSNALSESEAEAINLSLLA